MPTSIHPASPKARTAMVSGHLDLTDSEFEKLYAPLLHAAVLRGDNFVMGDAKGVDTMAADWLISQLTPSSDITLNHSSTGAPTSNSSIENRITIYCLRPYNVPKWEAKGVTVISDTPDTDTKTSGSSSIPGQAGRGQARGRGRGNRGRGRGGRGGAGNPNASRSHHTRRDARMTAASDYDILLSDINRWREVRSVQSSRHPTHDALGEWNQAYDSSQSSLTKCICLRILWPKCGNDA